VDYPFKDSAVKPLLLIMEITSSSAIPLPQVCCTP